MSMATATNSNNMQAANSQQEKKFKPMPLLAQISMMTWRSIYILLRSPGVVIPNLIIFATLRTVTMK